MTIYHRKLITALFILSSLTLLTGCQPVNTILPSPVPVTPTVQFVTTPTNAEQLYPSTPEEVIRAFLIAYPIDQIYAVQYLSPAYVEKLDAESVSHLLPATGEISGFIIEEGSSSAELEKSEILANVAFNDLSSRILFSLEIVDGRWAISQILPK
jgi:hypothetical protein